MEERDPHLSQAYREARHLEPSPGLDARILEAARQALARPKPTGRSRWFTWALPSPAPPYWCWGSPCCSKRSSRHRKT